MLSSDGQEAKNKVLELCCLLQNYKVQASVLSSRKHDFSIWVMLDDSEAQEADANYFEITQIQICLYV